MINDIEIRQIQFDPEKMVVRAIMNHSCGGDPHVFIERHGHSDSSLIPVGKYSRPIVNNELLSCDDYSQYLLQQQEKDKLNDVAAARKGDKRVKYGVLTLKTYNYQREYSLPNMIEGPTRFDQEFHCDVSKNQNSANLPMEKMDVYLPSSEEIAKVVEVIYEVKGDDDQFAKVQVTKSLRNTKLRAKDIDLVLNYLSEVLGCLIHVEVLKPATGRPPSPKYQILWGKTEYFQKRNKDDMSGC